MMDYMGIKRRPRAAPIDSNKLRKWARRLRVRARRMDYLADKLDAARVESVNVQHVAGTEDAIEKIRVFLAESRRKLRNRRIL